MQYDSVTTPKRFYQTPIWLLSVLVVSVFFIEALVMVLLSILPPMHEVISTFLDASLLSVLLFPVFYFLVFRPLIQNITRREQVEIELIGHRNHLEELVAARTKELTFGAQNN